MVISVAGNGIGMTKAEVDLIFKKFQRIILTCEGSGVGLYLVHTIVSGAGGKIMVESEPGQGSVFKIFLKADNQPA